MILNDIEWYWMILIFKYMLWYYEMYIYIYIQREVAEMVTGDWLVKCCLQAIRRFVMEWPAEAPDLVPSHRLKRNSVTTWPIRHIASLSSAGGVPVAVLFSAGTGRPWSLDPENCDCESIGLTWRPRASPKYYIVMVHRVSHGHQNLQ